MSMGRLVQSHIKSVRLIPKKTVIWEEEECGAGSQEALRVPEEAKSSVPFPKMEPLQKILQVCFLWFLFFKPVLCRHSGS